MPTIKLPEINVPEGCEHFAQTLLSSFTRQVSVFGNPVVVEDAAFRTMTTSMEHSFGQGEAQARVLASAAKSRKAKG